MHIISLSVIQLLTGVRKDFGNSNDLLLRQVPVAVLNGVSNAREILGVICVPSLRSEDDVLELFSTWKLRIMSA